MVRHSGTDGVGIFDETCREQSYAASGGVQRRGGAGARAALVECREGAGRVQFARAERSASYRCPAFTRSFIRIPYALHSRHFVNTIVSTTSFRITDETTAVGRTSEQRDDSADDEDDRGASFRLQLRARKRSRDDDDDDGFTVDK